MSVHIVDVHRHRLRRAASHLPGGLGTRPLPVLGQDPQPAQAYSCGTSSRSTERNAVTPDDYVAAAEGW
jgi:hypothetical protein